MAQLTPNTPQTRAQQAADLKNLLSGGGKAYDPDMTYRHSTSDRFSDPVTIKIPQDTNNILQYVAGNYDQFRSRQDFVRDAIHHRLHHFIDQDPAVPLRMQDLLDQEDWNEELLMQQRESLAEMEAFELTRERMNSMIDDRDWKGLQTLWERADEMADREDMPEGRRDRWAEQAEELFDGMTSLRKQRTKYQKMAEVSPIKSRKAQ